MAFFQPISNASGMSLTPFGLATGVVSGSGNVTIGPMGVASSMAGPVAITAANTVNRLGVASPFANSFGPFNPIQPNSFGAVNPFNPLRNTIYDTFNGAPFGSFGPFQPQISPVSNLRANNFSPTLISPLSLGESITNMMNPLSSASSALLPTFQNSALASLTQQQAGGFGSFGPSLLGNPSSGFNSAALNASSQMAALQQMQMAQLMARSSPNGLGGTAFATTGNAGSLIGNAGSLVGNASSFPQTVLAFGVPAAINFGGAAVPSTNSFMDFLATGGGSFLMNQAQSAFSGLNAAAFGAAQPSFPINLSGGIPGLNGLASPSGLNGIPGTSGFIPNGQTFTAPNPGQLGSFNVASPFSAGGTVDPFQLQQMMLTQSQGTGGKLVSPLGTFITSIGAGGGNANAGFLGAQAAGQASAMVLSALNPGMIVDYANPFYSSFNFNQGFFAT